MGLYKTNKGAKTGTIIECPVCHKKFKKIQYSQAFCCGKCKDKYHNMVDGDRHKITKVIKTTKVENPINNKIGNTENINIKSSNDADYNLRLKYFNLKDTRLYVGGERNSSNIQNDLFSIGIGRNGRNGMEFNVLNKTDCCVIINKDFHSEHLHFSFIHRDYAKDNCNCGHMERKITSDYLHAVVSGNVKHKYTDKFKKNKKQKVSYWTAMARQMEHIEKNREKWEMEHDDYDENPYDNYEGGYDDRDEVADGLHS